MKEFERRLALFTKIFKKIKKQNDKKLKLKFGLNQMSDWTDDEYSSILGLKNVEIPAEMPKDLPEPPKKKNGITNSTPIDWRQYSGVVTPIKDQ